MRQKTEIIGNSNKNLTFNSTLNIDDPRNRHFKSDCLQTYMNTENLDCIHLEYKATGNKIKIQSFTCTLKINFYADRINDLHL